MTKEFSCPHLQHCSGCSPLTADLRQQQLHKVEKFQQRSTLKKIEIHSAGEAFLRTRLDLSWSGDGWGFWNPEKSGITNIQSCQQVTPELDLIYQEFRKFKWSLKKASIRLRVSPKGLAGIWLDFANEDVKNLFAEKETLKALSEFASVEIGQRRKSLFWEDGRPRLQDPVYQPWISTFVDGQEFPLWSLIGGFSQTGPRAQKIISAVLEALLQKAGSQNLLEFGSGFGALTLPASANGRRKISALEVESRSIEGLKASLAHYSLKNIEIIGGDFQKKKSPQYEFDTYLVNPPRSGVGKLFETIPENVRSVIYMSCYPKSYFKDIEALQGQGFQGIESHLIDQFPQTPHSEWMSLWTRS